MVSPGSARRQIAGTLNAAYGDGLLSQDTLSERLDQLLNARLIDPWRLIGDLTVRRAGWSWPRRLRRAMATRLRASGIAGRVGSRTQPRLLALDWTGHQAELLIGRHRECDVVLSGPTVSRRHASLLFRDGSWVLRDLDSTNGTSVNGTRVGRCELRPGDQLLLGDEALTID